MKLPGMLGSLSPYLVVGCWGRFDQQEGHRSCQADVPASDACRCTARRALFALENSLRTSQAKGVPLCEPREAHGRNGNDAADCPVARGGNTPRALEQAKEVLPARLGLPEGSKRLLTDVPGTVPGTGTLYLTLQPSTDNPINPYIIRDIRYIRFLSGTQVFVCSASF